MKPIDVKTNTYIDFAVEKNDKDPRFKVVDYIRMSNCKNISDFNGKYIYIYIYIYTHVYVKPGRVEVDRQTVN